MPLYEYVCSDCDSAFEVRRSIKDIDAPTTCPQCHGEHVARQVSRVAAFTRGDGGSVSAVSGGGGCGGGCGGCSGSSCAGCASRN